MQISPTGKEENHPAIQLLLLGFAAIIGLIVFLLITVLLVFLMSGMDGIMSLTNAKTSGFKILLIAQQLGLFLFPAIALAIFEGKRPWNFYGMKAPKANWILFVFLIMLCSFPLMGYVNELNQKMSLPESLKILEDWMRKMEDEAAKSTADLLKMNSIGSFLTNIFLIAIIPAICEEFIFRGGLQRTLIRWFKNPHVAIWTSAIIFSTIHLQFFGFFPRLFLGAMFGYIYFLTKSIWYTIFAHFLNNGFAVAMAWYLQSHNLPITEDSGPPMPWYGYLISAILTIALFKYLKDKTSAQRETQNTESIA